LIDRNRKIMEEVLYRIRKAEMEEQEIHEEENSGKGSSK
jgi:hypothetical protein